MAQRLPSEFDHPDSMLLGDDALLEAMYRAYRGRVRDLCARLVGDRVRAEDLAQETFLRASAHMRRFRRDAAPWPWLATIARNLCTDELRRRTETPFGAAGEVIEALDRATASDDDLDQVLVLQERSALRGRVRAALGRLDPRDRQILLARDVEGLPYDKIAASDGATVDAVRNVAWRARRSVRAALEEPGYPALALLPAVLAAARSLGARLRARVQLTAASTRLESTLGAAQASLALMGATAIAATVLALSPAPGVGAGVATMVRSVSAPDQAAAPNAPDASAGDAEAGARGSDPAPGGPLRGTLSTSPPQRGGLGPSGGMVRLEVGPDGQTLLWLETGIRCGGQGARYLPQEGSVRAVC